jgi:hypothetical protein
LEDGVEVEYEEEFVDGVDETEFEIEPLDAVLEANSDSLYFGALT